MKTNYSPITMVVVAGGHRFIAGLVSSAAAGDVVISGNASSASDRRQTDQKQGIDGNLQVSVGVQVVIEFNDIVLKETW